MEMVMTKGFCELNSQEMMMVDGGWDGYQWLKGVGTIIVGAAIATGITIGVATGTPLSGYSATSLANSLNMFESGSKDIYYSFFS